MTERNYIIKVEKALFSKIYTPITKTPFGKLDSPRFQIAFHHTDLPDALKSTLKQSIATAIERDKNSVGHGYIFAYSNLAPVVVDENMGEAGWDHGSNYDLKRIGWDAEYRRIPMDDLINETAVRINVTPVINERLAGPSRHPPRLELHAVQIDCKSLRDRLEFICKAAMQRVDDWKEEEL